MNMKIRRDAEIPAAYVSFVFEDRGSLQLERVILEAIEALKENESWIQDVSVSEQGNTIAIIVFYVRFSESEESLSFEERTTRIDGIVDTIQQVVEEAIRVEREQAEQRREREEWAKDEERTLSI